APFGIDFPPVPQPTHDRLFAVLGEIPTISNPLDYHTFIWGDGPKTTEVFTAMLEAYDAGIYIIDTPRTDRCSDDWYQPALDAIVAAQEATGRIAVPVASMAENFGEGRVAEMREQGVCALLGLETALAAIRAAQTPAGLPGWRPAQALPPRDASMLSEAEGKALLSAAGVAVPRSVTATTLQALDVTRLAAPYVLKGLGFAHKTEAGAVRLGLTSLEGQQEMPGATGYLVEEMVTGVVAEVLLGLRRDPVYGVTLTLGMGGVTAEVLADTVTLVLPAPAEEVLAAARRLRRWPVPEGDRGRPKADMAAVAGMAVKLGALLLSDDSLEEFETSPVLVRQDGAVAVEALIRKV